MKQLSYSELSKMPAFKDRLLYLKQNAHVGEDTFGFDRILNQQFYRSTVWRNLRNRIILRDNGCDLGVEGHEITGKIIIHHMNPIEPMDMNGNFEQLMNPEYLICVSMDTHNAIHYGRDTEDKYELTERAPNDTCPWKKG